MISTVKSRSLSLALGAMLVLPGMPLAGQSRPNPKALEKFRQATKGGKLEREAEEMRELRRKAQANLARKPEAKLAYKAAPVTPQLGRANQAPASQPQEAMDFYLAKRVPEGGLTQPIPSMLAEAVEQAERMPLYSTAERRTVGFGEAPRGREGRAVAERQAGVGTWSPLGPGNVGGRTRALLIHPTTPNIMWTAGVAGGIWKTTDGGLTWNPKSDLLVNIAVNSMIFDPRDTNILYAGTGEGFFNSDAVRGAGIFKSVDGGETWSQLSTTTTPDFHFVNKLAQTRAAAQRIYAATRTGIFRSADSGATWTKVYDGTALNGCMDVAIQTDRALAMVFATCGTFTQSRIIRALDTAGTMNWVTVHSPANMGRTSLAIAPSNQSIVYALAASNESGNFNQGLLAVYRSSNSGAAGSWTTQVSNTSPVTLNRLLLSNPVIALLQSCGFGTSSFLNQGWYDNIIAVDPVDPNIVWAGGIDLFRSNDGGQNWGQASHWWFTPGVDPEYAHADQHIIAFHPQYDGTSNKTMYVGNDGGLFRTTDARAAVSFSPNPITPASAVCGGAPPPGLSWGNLNNGYEVTQFYHGLPYPDGQTFFGGTQDNGTVRGTIGAGRNAWSSVRGGDGGYVAINPGNTSMIWVENTNLSIQRSVDGGSTFVNVTSGIGEASGNFLFIAPFTMDPSNANRMWIGGARMWRANNAAAAVAPNPYWTLASPFFGTRVSAIAVAPSDSNRVYAGTQTGTVFTTNVAGTSTGTTTWTSSAPRAGTNFVSSLAVHPTDPLTVYATVSTFNAGASVGHLFRSVNGGASWTNIDGSGATGIPDVPAHSIVIDPSNVNRLYLGTDIGVFVSIDGGANWARENTGFANVITEWLAVNPATNQLYAFTHGRSAWRVPLVP